MKNESEVAQLCPTLSNPMDCSLPGFSINGTLQARVLEWGAITFSSLSPRPELFSPEYIEKTIQINIKTEISIYRN